MLYNKLVTFLLIISLTSYVTEAQRRAQRRKNRPILSRIKKLLVNYGYLRSFSDGDNERNLKKSLYRFQHFANLPMTGKLDAKTQAQFDVPRCANKDPFIKLDIPGFSDKKRGKRYVHQGTKWSKQLLTWRLVGRGRTLDRETIRRVMYKAFKLWSDVTNMDFKEVTGDNPDIWVKFVRHYHEDPYPFDGEGGTLAHAFYPHNQVGLAGDVHFDDDENYTYKSPKGRNLLWVATHEIGHSLGLEHSNERKAIMYPWYTEYRPGFTLEYDDILGIQTLYGSRVAPTQATTPAPTKPTYSKQCPANIKAIYYNSLARLTMIFTKDDKILFMKDNSGIKYGPYPRTSYFKKSRIPNRITAAFATKSLQNNKELHVLFSGNKYYIYRHLSYVSGPHEIYTGKNPLKLRFPSWVQRIDGAMTWYRNKRTYFFYGNYYWRYKNEKKEMDKNYPKQTNKAWRVPTPVSAVYCSAKEKVTYFIKDGCWYELDNQTIQVKSGYPKLVSEWLKCNGGSCPAAGGFSIGSISAGKGKWGPAP